MFVLDGVVGFQVFKRLGFVGDQHERLVDSADHVDVLVVELLDSYCGWSGDKFWDLVFHVEDIVLLHYIVVLDFIFSNHKNSKVSYFFWNHVALDSR